jgi:hypothetical protein
VSELEINQTHITETMIFYASIFNLFFHFQIFFLLQKGFGILVIDGFLLQKSQSLLVVLGGGGLAKREMVIEDEVRFGCKKKSSVESLQ